MKSAKALWLLAGTVALQIIACGYKPALTCSVTQYGPKYMTFRGSDTLFMDACRKVLYDLGYKEQIDKDRFRYPHHGEGASSHRDNGRVISMERYMQTQDADGAEYKITVLTVGAREPLVQLQSTSQDSYKLVNALSAEFSRRRIKVTQYSP